MSESETTIAPTALVTSMGPGPTPAASPELGAISSQPREEIIIRPPGAFTGIDWRELWRYRGTLARKIKQRIRMQYDDMLFGFLWAVARPLIMVFVFWAFRGLAAAQMGVTIPYPLYVYSGLVVWFFFTDALTAVAMSLQRDAGIIQKVYFPRLLSPLSHLLSETYNLLLAAVPLAVMMAAWGEPPGWKFLLLPLVMAQLLLLCLGVGMIFSALALRSRDWERLMKFALYIGLWVSPVIYSVDRIPGNYQLVYLINPMGGTLLGMRSALFGQLEFPWGSWLYALGFSLAVIIVGLLAFQRSERFLADKI